MIIGLNPGDEDGQKVYHVDIVYIYSLCIYATPVALKKRIDYGISHSDIASHR